MSTSSALTDCPYCHSQDSLFQSGTETVCHECGTRTSQGAASGAAPPSVGYPLSVASAELAGCAALFNKASWRQAMVQAGAKSVEWRETLFSCILEKMQLEEQPADIEPYKALVAKYARIFRQLHAAGAPLPILSYYHFRRCLHLFHRFIMVPPVCCCCFEDVAEASVAANGKVVIAGSHIFSCQLYQLRSDTWFAFRWCNGGNQVKSIRKMTVPLLCNGDDLRRLKEKHGRVPDHLERCESFQGKSEVALRAFICAYLRERLQYGETVHAQLQSVRYTAAIPYAICCIAWRCLLADPQCAFSFTQEYNKHTRYHYPFALERALHQVVHGRLTLLERSSAPISLDIITTPTSFPKEPYPFYHVAVLANLSCFYVPHKHPGTDQIYQRLVISIYGLHFILRFQDDPLADLSCALPLQFSAGTHELPLSALFAARTQQAVVKSTFWLNFASYACRQMEHVVGSMSQEQWDKLEKEIGGLFPSNHGSQLGVLRATAAAATSATSAASAAGAAAAAAPVAAGANTGSEIMPGASRPAAVLFFEANKKDSGIRDKLREELGLPVKRPDGKPTYLCYYGRFILRIASALTHRDVIYAPIVGLLRLPEAPFQILRADIVKFVGRSDSSQSEAADGVQYKFCLFEQKMGADGRARMLLLSEIVIDWGRTVAYRIVLGWKILRRNAAPAAAQELDTAQLCTLLQQQQQQQQQQPDQLELKMLQCDDEMFSELEGNLPMVKILAQAAGVHGAPSPRPAASRSPVLETAVRSPTSETAPDCT